MKVRISVDIAGMSCGHCVARVMQALRSVDGVEIERVAVGSATISYDAGVVSPDAIARSIESQGYTVAAPR